MQIYYVTLHSGHAGLVRASDNIDTAQNQIYMEEGRSNVRSIRIATEEDIAWVKAMGGYVPEVGKR